MRERALALKPGDTIALVRPAGGLDQKHMDAVSKCLRSLGFFVASYPLPKKKAAYFAGSDEHRAAEWMWAFTEPGIKCVWACRGGYGSARTLELLNQKKLKKSPPKMFINYSDLTLLHQWHLNAMNRVSFHGSILGILKPAEIKFAVNEVLKLQSKPHIQKWSEIKVLQSGSAKGVLVGGNLSLLQTSGVAALPRQPMILALEDVNEDFYSLDRMIWTLIHAGYAPFVKGIILGTLKGCGANDKKIFPFTYVEESLRRLCKGPIWTRAKFGHGLRKQRLLALGCRVAMREKVLHYLEGQVR